MKYNVEYTYTEPRWGAVLIEAIDLEDAEAQATDYIEQTYPEAVDIDITKVAVTDGN